MPASIRKIKHAFSLPQFGLFEKDQLLYRLAKYYIDHLEYPEIPKTPEPGIASSRKQLDDLKIKFQPDSAYLKSELYTYLIENLTPKHFLSDSLFDRQRKKFYTCEHGTAECKHEEDYYNDPKNLSEVGRVRVWLELKRLEIAYLKKYYAVFVVYEKDSELKKEKETLLTPDIFLALYLYTTNLGYKKINSQLRFGHSNGCEDWICKINRGIERLSSFPEFQLDPKQHKLIRYMNLPDEVLRDIVQNTMSMNKFLDRAFLSTSFKQDGAGEFALSANFELIIKTNGSCHGAKIDGISPFPGEGEYLFCPGTKFECHPDRAIVFDHTKNKYQIYVCAVSLGSVAQTVITVQKAIKLFRKPLKACPPPAAPVELPEITHAAGPVGAGAAGARDESVAEKSTPPCSREREAGSRSHATPAIRRRFTLPAESNPPAELKLPVIKDDEVHEKEAAAAGAAPKPSVLPDASLPDLDTTTRRFSCLG